jgi:hypothetical protein
MPDDNTPLPEEPARTRDRKQKRTPEAKSPEEIAMAALEKGATQVDAQMMGLPCGRCGEYPGFCVGHEWISPSTLLVTESPFDPQFVGARPLPPVARRYTVNERVFVDAFLPDGTPTRVLKYKFGDIIDVDEARNLGLLSADAEPASYDQVMAEHGSSIPAEAVGTYVPGGAG